MTTSEPAVASIVLWMALFVVVGAPCVYLVWEFINQVLTGHFELTRLGLAVVGTIGAVAVLKLVASKATRWDGG